MSLLAGVVIHPMMRDTLKPFIGICDALVATEARLRP
jgi:hypothetical protein